MVLQASVARRRTLRCRCGATGPQTKCWRPDPVEVSPPGRCCWGSVGQGQVVRRGVEGRLLHAYHAANDRRGGQVSAGTDGGRRARVRGQRSGGVLDYCRGTLIANLQVPRRIERQGPGSVQAGADGGDEARVRSQRRGRVLDHRVATTEIGDP